MPLTTLQKRWLKAIYLDPRVKLFGVDFPDLCDVEPLFTAADYFIYDQYNDGDPFEDAQYIRNFRIILEAIRKGSQIKFEMINRKGNVMFVRCRPVRLEYSEKDDKFRLVTAGWRSVSTVNLSKIRACAHDTGCRRVRGRENPVAYDTITVKIRDERNAMERFMLHFAHFEKQAEKLDQIHYLVKIKYAHDDESEMVIRILSFGPMIEVLEPEPFRKLVIEKLEKQLSCGLK
jgi:predicted DNA-binding transcriptional regulator YafY